MGCMSNWDKEYKQKYGPHNGVRGDNDGKGRAGAGADSKSGGDFGRLEYSTTNTYVGVEFSKRGTKDA
jgi:hypothetical protein